MKPIYKWDWDWAADQEEYYIKLDDTRRHATKKIEFRKAKQKWNIFRSKRQIENVLKLKLFKTW